ncbi:MAG: uroporphyrinogen decarboxylase family protein [Anaerolineae bacterium]
MTAHTAGEFLPVEVVFNPNWWFRTAGISFDAAFYLDAETRIRNDVTMRRVLYERYGEMGLGEAEPQPRPVVGSLHVAGGFVIPALLGARIRFAPDAAPQPEPLEWTMEQVEALEVPDWREAWPMRHIVADMDALEAEYGYLIGDLNTDGLLNAAYHLYGQELYVDFYRAPARARRVLDVIAALIVDVALYVRGRTGSCSIAVNRMVERVDAAMFLHANCSVQMISPASYRALHLPVEQAMARRVQPFGVHHCGDNAHRIAPAYAELPLAYLEVGWGSDVAACRRALPDAFLNLRLSPVRMLQCTPGDIARDTEALLLAAGPLERVGVCCINMDAGTPDENIRAMFDVIRRYRSYGA